MQSFDGPDPAWLATSRARVRGLRGRYRQHITDYTGHDHEIINSWLRGSILSRRNADRARSRTKSLDAVLGEFPLTRTTRLSRVVSLYDVFGLTDGSNLSKFVGAYRIEDGYLSTSRRRAFSMRNQRLPAVFDVIAPTGIPAAAIEDISAVPNQFEILLGRSLEYFIADPAYDELNEIWRAAMVITGRRDGS